MILNENIIKDLKRIKVEDGEGDIETEIAKVLETYKIRFSKVYQNELSPEFVRVYKDNMIIILMSLAYVIEIDDDDIETDFIIINEIEEV